MTDWLPFPARRPGGPTPPGWANEAEAILTQMRAQIDARPDPTAVKTVPHQVTGVLASASFPVVIADTPQGTVRYPVKFAAPVTRFRVHVRNYSYGDAAGYTGTVNLTGLWWGEGAYNLNYELDGKYAAAPAQVNGAATLTGSTEWVSGWITVNASEGTDHLLSIGWTTPASGAPTNIVSNWTRRYVSTSAANASQQSPTLSSGDGPGGPFDVWLECEIPAATPVVAFIGDSITIGNMHGQCYPRRWALAHESWPIIFGHYGGLLSSWGAGSTDRWTRYGALAVDATVLLAGTNDIFVDTGANDLKFRVADVIGRIRTYLGPRVFLATVLPCNGSAMTAPRESVRVSHNDWLVGHFRRGVSGTFDLARSVANLSNAAQMVAAYTWDGTHLSELGAVQVAAAIPHLTRG